MKFDMVVYFDLRFHIGRGGASSVHWVAAKCSIFDQNLLQIAISQEVLERFERNSSWGIPFGRRIRLPNLKLLRQPEGLLQAAANLIILQQASFLALERMSLKLNSK